jgi:hypothetical protein
MVYSADVWDCSPVAGFCDFAAENGDKRENDEEKELHFDTDLIQMSDCEKGRRNV